jgi:hypothetical protein
VLLLWIIERRLPDHDILIPSLAKDKASEVHTTADHMTCVRCWGLGEKYQIPTFQDLIMLELVDSLDRWELSLQSAREGFETTPPESKLSEPSRFEGDCIFGS